jgi:hypothetical protein
MLASVAWLVGSCANVSPKQTTSEAAPRFHEGAAADMVLRFFTWNSIYITKPDIREGGFRPMYARDDIGREVKSRNINRHTAVVVLSLFYRDATQIAQLSHEWTTYLNAQGFRRVVILHAGPGTDIDGLPVLNDSTIAGVNVSAIHGGHPRVGSANPTVASATGPDVGPPSGAAVR